MNIKKLIYFLLLILSTFSFSKIPEYKIFAKAKSEYNHSKFKEAEYFFKIFNQKFSNSGLANSNLQNLYLGKIKIQQHQDKEAIKYLLESPKTDETYYLLGTLYENLKNSKTSFLFYKKSYDNCNDNPKLKEKILKSLSHFDFSYNLLYKAMFDKNFIDFWELSEKNSLIIGNYFFDLNKFSKALYFFSTIQDKKNNILLGKKFFCLKEYQKAITFFKKDTSPENIILIIKSYEKLGEIRKAKYYRTILIKKAPHSEMAASFRFQLYELENNLDYLKYILKSNSKDSIFYSKAVYILSENGVFDFTKKEKQYANLIQDLDEISQINIPEGIKIKLDNYIFPKEDINFKSFLEYKYIVMQKKAS